MCIANVDIKKAVGELASDFRNYKNGLTKDALTQSRYRQRVENKICIQTETLSSWKNQGNR